MPNVADYRILFTADDSGFKDGAGRVATALTKIDDALNKIGTKFTTFAEAVSKASLALDPLKPTAYADALKNLAGIASALSPEFSGLAVDVKALNSAFGSKAPLTYGNRLSGSAGTAIDMAEKVKLAAKEVAELNKQLLAARGLRNINISGGGGGTGSSGFDLKNVAQAGRQVGTSLTRTVTMPLLAIGAAATFVGVQFEAAMSKIQGLAGVSKQQTDAWSASLLKLGPAVGKTPTELAEGLFHVASEGYRGTEAIDILTRAAKMSAIGMGDMINTSKALVFVMHDYANSGMTAAMAADTLTAAVRVGNMSADTLTTNLGKVLPIAAALKISFADIAAAFVTMTREGSSTAQAATALTAVITTIETPSNKAKKGLAELAKSTGDSSLNFAELRAEMKDNLLGALLHVSEAAKGSDTAFTNVFGTVRNLRGTLGILGSNVKETKALFAQMRDTTHSLDSAFNVTAATASQKFKQALASLEVAGISLFTTLAPSILAVVSRVKEAAIAVGNWDASTKKMVITGLALAAVVGPGILLLSRAASGVILYRAAVDLLNQRLAAQAIAQTAANAATAGTAPASALAILRTDTLGVAFLKITGTIGKYALAVKALQVDLLGLAAVAAIPEFVAHKVFDMTTAIGEEQSAQGPGTAMVTLGLQGYIRARRKADFQAHQRAEIDAARREHRPVNWNVADMPSQLTEQQLVNDYKKTRDFRQLAIGAQGAAGRNKGNAEGELRDALANADKKLQDSLNSDRWKDHGATDPSTGKPKKDHVANTERNQMMAYAQTVRIGIDASKEAKAADDARYGRFASHKAQVEGLRVALAHLTSTQRGTAFVPNVGNVGDIPLGTVAKDTQAFARGIDSQKNAASEEKSGLSWYAKMLKHNVAQAKKDAIEAEKNARELRVLHTRQASFYREVQSELARATAIEDTANADDTDARRLAYVESRISHSAAVTSANAKYVSLIAKMFEQARLIEKYGADFDAIEDKKKRDKATSFDSTLADDLAKINARDSLVNAGTSSAARRQATIDLAIADNANFHSKDFDAKSAADQATAKSDYGSAVGKRFDDEETKKYYDNFTKSVSKSRDAMQSLGRETDQMRVTAKMFDSEGMQQMTEAQAKFAVAVDKSVEKMKQMQAEAEKIIDNFTQHATNIVEGVFNSGTHNLFQNMRKQLQDTLKEMAMDVVRSQIKKALTDAFMPKPSQGAGGVAAAGGMAPNISAGNFNFGSGASATGLTGGFGSGSSGSLLFGGGLSKLFAPFLGGGGGVNSLGFNPADPTTFAALADGGDYQAGKPRVVGERGPELDVPSSSGHVFPNGSSPGGGHTFHNENHIHIYGDGGNINQDTMDQIHAAAFEGSYAAYQRVR